MKRENVRGGCEVVSISCKACNISLGINLPGGWRLATKRQTRKSCVQVFAATRNVALNDRPPRRAATRCHWLGRRQGERLTAKNTAVAEDMPSAVPGARQPLENSVVCGGFQRAAGGWRGPATTGRCSAVAWACGGGKRTLLPGHDALLPQSAVSLGCKLAQSSH